MVKSHSSFSEDVSCSSCNSLLTVKAGRAAEFHRVEVKEEDNIPLARAPISICFDITCQACKNSTTYVLVKNAFTLTSLLEEFENLEELDLRLPSGTPFDLSEYDLETFDVISNQQNRE